MGLDFVGLGSMLKCGFGYEFENETDEVDVIVDFGGVVKWWILPCFVGLVESGNEGVDVKRPLNLGLVSNINLKNWREFNLIY